MPHPATIPPDNTPAEIGKVFTELTVVDSSNNYAMAMVHAGKAFHGNVFFAHEQTAGRGQRGKKWTASRGENIMMSVVIQPGGFLPGQQFQLSICMALACYDLLNIYLPGEIYIKWPNDLYIRDRKTGGILIENIISGENWKYAIAGIGININQSIFDQHLPNPISLRLATGKSYEVIALAKDLCGLMDKRFSQLMKGAIMEMLAAYNLRLYKRNEKVKLKKNSQVFETTIREVDLFGHLLTRDVMDRSFNYGEVEWLL